MVERGKAGKLLLQGNEFGTLGGSEETVIANFHKTVRQNVLKETLDEFFSGEGATLELTVIPYKLRALTAFYEGPRSTCHQLH